MWCKYDVTYLQTNKTCFQTLLHVVPKQSERCKLSNNNLNGAKVEIVLHQRSKETGREGVQNF